MSATEYPSYNNMPLQRPFSATTRPMLRRCTSSSIKKLLSRNCPASKFFLMKSSEGKSCSHKKFMPCKAFSISPCLSGLPQFSNHMSHSPFSRASDFNRSFKSIFMLFYVEHVSTVDVALQYITYLFGEICIPRRIVSDEFQLGKLRLRYDAHLRGMFIHQPFEGQSVGR